MNNAALATDKSGEQQINRFGNLPAMPEVTTRILSALKQADVSTADLSRLISSDVALSTRILKVVNSVFYGLPRQISNLDRAVVVLGRNTIRNITLAASMGKVFNATGRVAETRFDLRSLWVHSSATAAAAQMIAQDLRKADPNEVFLAGLTHDIGIMAELYWSHERLNACIDQLTFDENEAPEQDLRRLESETFGVNHEETGSAACEHWNFPEVIGSVAGHHHSPLIAPEEHQFIACIVYVADRLSATLPGSFRLDLPSTDICDDVLGELSLHRDSLEGYTERLTAVMEELSQLFG